MQAKNNLDSKQEQLDQELADVVKAIAVNTKMQKSLLTVKKAVQEEDYDAKEEEEEEEEDNVKEEEEETEMCNGVCTVWTRTKRGELQFCYQKCNLGPSHDPDLHCNCCVEHVRDPKTGDLKLKVEEYKREWRDSESKRRRRKIPAPPPFPKWRRRLEPTQPPFPPPTQADEESAEEESAVPVPTQPPYPPPTQADEESAEQESAVSDKKSSEEMCGREERDEEDKQDADERFAWIWFEQNGVDSNIPKEYSPCVYFSKAKNSCTINKCQFSHNKIFRDEPFAALLKDLTWESVRPPPRQTSRKRR